ncbi:MAG: UvrD-helicase domain-containing protein, partial [Chrysiogenetes bacterium]|nr:UvrD-helicase domain-containing protein [Chrysiogenetes bacterium]
MSDEQQIRLRDGEARELARSSFEHPIVLEAGAGTGKTATLVARVLTWCLGPGWARAAEDLTISRGGDADARIFADEVAVRVADRIAAITFTERAAAEMKERIARGFAAVLRGEGIVGLELERFEEPLEILTVRAKHLLAVLDHFFVGTIHAFCRRLLAQYALPAGVHPGFVVDADEGMSNSLIEDVLADRLQEVYGDPGDENLLALAAMGWGPAEIVEALGELIRGGVPAEALAHDPYAPELVKQAASELAAPLEAFIGLAAGPLAEGKGNLNAARSVLEALGTLATRLANVSEAGELRDLALEVDVKRLREWGEGKLNKTESKALAGIEDEVQAAAAPLAARIRHLQSLDPDLLPRACVALRELLGNVQARLRAEGIETFAALLRDTRDLLAGDEVLRGHVRQRFDQLLVDEFQDTDPVQYEIIEYLALDGPSFERPGLFLIGDPKQSIYGWRGADLGAYARFIARVKDEGGEIHSLQVNFRSVPAILSEV